MSIHIGVEGRSTTIQTLKNITVKASNEIKGQILKSGLIIESKAKDKAPVDTGLLRAEVETRISDGGFTYEVFPTSKYAAFVEFGTKPHFPPPQALAGWARRHGLSGREYLIARAIARRGTRPQPFLFPAYEAEKDNFIESIKRILKSLE